MERLKPACVLVVGDVNREGIAPDKIHLAGNVMIDALLAAEPSWSRSSIFDRLGLEKHRPYALLTLHRPANVNDPEALLALLEAIHEVGQSLPVLFSVHPRVKRQLHAAQEFFAADAGSGQAIPDRGIICCDPLGYVDFVALMSRARLVMTDSGGIQEETTVLGVPCLTLRETTERPITVTHGTNRVVGTEPRRIVEATVSAMVQPPPSRWPIPFWDGQAAKRIVEILVETYTRHASTRPTRAFNVASGEARALA